MIFPEPVTRAVAEHPYPLIFATVSGAHLYGFPSADSDWDVRGVHVLPLREVLGLEDARETIEKSRRDSGMELDFVTHDARKFFKLLLRKNGYVLEQLYSPIVVHSTGEHEELKRIAKGCVTRHHSHHYLGFAANQWRLFEKGQPPRLKPLLYIYRVLLTGIHLMRTGEVEANLVRLNDQFRLPYLPELISIKTQGVEGTMLSPQAVEFHRAEFTRLVAELEEASERSSLPAASSARPELSRLLVCLREKYC